MAKRLELDVNKLRKLHELRNSGVNPYPYTFSQTHKSTEILTRYASLKNEEHAPVKDISPKVAGRIMLKRIMGKASFIHLQDELGRIQLYLSQDNLGEELYGLIIKKTDIGDILGVQGTVFRTKMGELTIKVTTAEILCKSLLPLPEKFHGLKDIELKYRQRYLDLIMNQDVKTVFVKRSKMIKVIRDYFIEKGFMEVETPVLQTIYGGANAKPFVTHINTWNMKMFMSVSPELFLKRLMVGGFEKVFTICKNFRNEDVDTTHNPEFTMLEIYQAYVDYKTMMEYLEQVYERACIAMHGSTKVKHMHKGEEVIIDFKAPWKRMTLLDAIKHYGKVDATKMTVEHLIPILKQHKIEYSKDLTWGEAVQRLFEELVEQHLIQPVHITDHPVETTPLCKTHQTDKRLIERFESFCIGMEISNAYSELNDPIIQRALLEEQAAKLRAGGEENHPMDEDFVNAIEYGMPPAGGMGFGIDRMAIILTGVESIRDVIFFPTMKPVVEEMSESEAQKKYRSKKLVVIANEHLNSGVIANAIGQLGISIGGHSKHPLFDETILHDAEKRVHYTDSLYPMTNLAGSKEQMAKFAMLCYDAGIQFHDFSDVMRQAHTDKQMRKGYAEKKTVDLDYIAVGALIPAEFAKEFLATLKLFGAEKSK